eukprot:365418-Chlamydomonas_euryale.AAC.8
MQPSHRGHVSFVCPLKCVLYTCSLHTGAKPSRQPHGVPPDGARTINTGPSGIHHLTDCVHPHPLCCPLSAVAWRLCCQTGMAPCSSCIHTKFTDVVCLHLLCSLPPQSANQAASVLSDSERSTLLHHLKKKWGSLNEAYQKGGLCVDSQPKKV